MTKDRVIKFTGTLTKPDGTQEEVEDRPLAFVDFEGVDYAAGLTSETMYVCDPEELDNLDDEGYEVDPYAFFSQECEQTGGHNYVDHQWSEEAESACQICTRCGDEIDPA